MSSIVIVGAGVFGASLAHRLAGTGWDVNLVEQYSPGHVRASSGGESRLIRCSHGGDEWYLRSARRARTLWREIEAESGESLYLECGVCWFAAPDSEWDLGSEASLHANGVPVERLDPAEARTLYPDLRTDDLGFVLLEPEAGVLRARNAVMALAKLAERRGARMVTGTARPHGARVLVDGESLDADVVVWAGGPWLAGLFPDVVPVRIMRTEIVFLGAPPPWSAQRVPAWVDHGRDTYGVGDLDGRGFKVGWDLDGPPIDPDTADRKPDGESELQIRMYLSSRFPSLAGAPLVGHRVCQYTLTVDRDFVIARHPEERSVWLYGAGSGHGFKHGPALAEYFAGIIEADADPDERFALDSRNR